MCVLIRVSGRGTKLIIISRKKGIVLQNKVGCPAEVVIYVAGEVCSKVIVKEKIRSKGVFTSENSRPNTESMAMDLQSDRFSLSRLDL